MGEPQRILFVEASTGGVVGGSLTGILPLIAYLDRTRFTPTLALFEPKAIATDSVPLHVLPPLARPPRPAPPADAPALRGGRPARAGARPALPPRAPGARLPRQRLSRQLGRRACRPALRAAGRLSRERLRAGRPRRASRLALDRRLRLHDRRDRRLL